MFDPRAAAGHPASGPDRARRCDSRRVGDEDGSGATGSVQDRRLGPHHRASAITAHGYPKHPAVERGAVLQGAEEDRAAQLRPHQSRRHRGIHRGRRLSGALQGADRRHAPELSSSRSRPRKLRGRGGAGFPTGIKWEFLRKAKADQKYIICNADEGDPGAYMNRNEIESDPHSLLEGMIIGGLHHGRHRRHHLRARRVSAGRAPAESGHRPGPRIRHARRQHPRPRLQVRHRNGRRRGRFRLRRRNGADRSLEGRAGRPRPRPPFPAQKGLWGNPTNINNVETWCNIPPIVAKGAGLVHRNRQHQERRHQGLLAGRQGARTPAWSKCRWARRCKTFVYDVGEGGIAGHAGQGRADRRSVGRLHPAGDVRHARRLRDRSRKLGAIMGSGGMVVMDEDNCMVDVARYFIEFTHSESCGKCIALPRRARQGAAHPERASPRAEAREEDLDRAGRTGPHDPRHARSAGSARPRPIRCSPPCAISATSSRTTSVPHRCRAGVCQDLALSPCENSCPLHMNIPRFLQLYKEGRLEEAFESVILDNPLPGFHRPRLPASLRQPLPPPDRRRAGQHARSASADRRLGLRCRTVSTSWSSRIAAVELRADRPQGGRGRRRARRASPPPSTWRCWVTR